MKKKDRRAYNSTLRPLSLKRQEEVSSGKHKQEKRATLSKVSKEKMRQKGAQVINQLLGEGKIQRAASLDRQRARIAKTSQTELAKLDSQLTTLFSQVVRLKACDSDGRVTCFICHRSVPYAESVLMHYQPRKERGTRFSEVACQAGCSDCNNKPNGDRKNFARRLNEKYGEGTSSRMDIQSKQTMRYDRGWYRHSIWVYEQQKIKLQGRK